MFVPTIKYRRVNDPPKDILKSLNELSIAKTEKNDFITNVVDSTIAKVNEQEEKKKKEEEEVSPKEAEKIIKEPKAEIEANKKVTAVPEYIFEEEKEEESTIEVDPNDKERIIVTLSTGKQFSADRYCPHAGADLSYHSKVSEHDYPPEIGPILICPIHYWEFALEKNGKGGGGWATINACPIEVEEKCASSGEKKRLDW